ncbi:hypothetical protein KXR83_04940 [Williamsia muralis]|uniref:hypothetical protein n=1 Tax=Williamsia marianensis TaxID=85044 RepID=UPI003F145D59
MKSGSGLDGSDLGRFVKLTGPDFAITGRIVKIHHDWTRLLPDDSPALDHNIFVDFGELHGGQWVKVGHDQAIHLSDSVDQVENTDLTFGA